MSQPNDPVIKTEKLSRSFDGVKAVNELDIDVHKGEVFGLVGPDGAGKTTTMRMLAGILDPTGGKAWVNGILVNESPEEIKKTIAYMPQRFGLYQDLTVLENLTFYADLFQVPKKERPQRMDQLFEFSRLGPFKERLAAALSGGMKQKLGLACALIHSPSVLLLDEPTNGVDPVSRRDFWKILHDLVREGITILVSTAYLDEAERTHRVGLMNHGSILHCDEPSEIKAKVEGVMFEVITSDPRRSREILSSLDGVIDANVFGEGLHALTENEDVGESFEDALLEKDIKIESQKRIVPSIEDAFLSLIPQEKELQLNGDDLEQ
jgi:ABC-2 type transport system ATP-binding protein